MSEPNEPSRRPSSESASMATRRLSTGSDRTAVVPDKSPCSGDIRTITAPAGAPVSRKDTTSTRQKAYHFDDEPVGGGDDMHQTARALVSHAPPTHRHNILSHHPVPVNAQVQNVNNMENQNFHPPPTVIHPMLKGVVVGVPDDASVGTAPALSVGPVSQRVSSLTHVVPPAAYPQGSLTSFYPDFLRKRVTPARHDVVAEEVDKELLAQAHEPGAWAVNLRVCLNGPATSSRIRMGYPQGRNMETTHGNDRLRPWRIWVFQNTTRNGYIQS